MNSFPRPLSVSIVDSVECKTHSIGTMKSEGNESIRTAEELMEKHGGAQQGCVPSKESTDLNSSHVLQGGFVAEKHGGAVQFEKILAFEFAEGAADGFARAADELGDFFMSERQLDAEDTLTDFAVGRPIDQEAR